MDLCTSVGFMALKEKYVGREGAQQAQHPELPDLSGTHPILVDGERLLKTKSRSVVSRAAKATWEISMKMFSAMRRLCLDCGGRDTTFHISGEPVREAVHHCGLQINCYAWLRGVGPPTAVSMPRYFSSSRANSECSRAGQTGLCLKGKKTDQHQSHTWTREWPQDLQVVKL